MDILSLVFGREADTGGITKLDSIQTNTSILVRAQPPMWEQESVWQAATSNVTRIKPPWAAAVILCLGFTQMPQHKLSSLPVSLLVVADNDSHVREWQITSVGYGSPALFAYIAVCLCPRRLLSDPTLSAVKNAYNWRSTTWLTGICDNNIRGSPCREKLGLHIASKQIQYDAYLMLDQHLLTALNLTFGLSHQQV